MKKYRVECNFGSKYFEDAARAFAFFHKCRGMNYPTEVWLVSCRYLKPQGRYSVKQELLDYFVPEDSGTN